MRGVSAPSLVPASKIECRKVPVSEENFRSDFGIVARALWPEKTAAELAALAGATERAARDWLAGRVEPPGCIIAVIVSRCVHRRD